MQKSIRAGGIVLNSKNQIALGFEHLWGFPRGGVNEGEEILAAAKREILEEVGITEQNLELIEEIGTYERYPGGITAETPGAFPMEIHMYFFKSEQVELTPADTGVREARWIPISEVPVQLSNDIDKQFFIDWATKKGLLL